MLAEYVRLRATFSLITSRILITNVFNIYFADTVRYMEL